MLGVLNWHRKDASIFTIAQKRHIKNVQSILGFPLNRPYQHLSAQMQDWHYTEFQTALTIAWLITGQGRNATSATTASLKAITLGCSNTSLPGTPSATATYYKP